MYVCAFELALACVRVRVGGEDMRAHIYLT